MFVIVYDITEDKVRNKISDLLKDYGMRVQYSVFESDITEEEAKKLQTIIERQIDKEKDSVKFYYITERCYEKSVFLGKEVQTAFPAYIEI